MRKFIFSFFVTALVLLSGCNFINPPEDIPAYIYIPAFQLQTNQIEEGSASHNITDAWVYMENNPVGAFELPAEIPVLSEGTTQFTIIPGIKVNGIAATRDHYPFYEFYVTELDLTSGKVDTIHPVTAYDNEVNFALIENFEGGNDFSGMSVTSDPEEVFEGTRSGHIQLDATQNDFFAYSSRLPLPIDGRRIFMEMDYKNDANFHFSIISHNFTTGTSESFDLLTVTKQDAWNKIYVELTSPVNQLRGDEFQLIFHGKKPEDATEASFFWDNIKVLHY